MTGAPVRPLLPSVTLVAVTSVAVGATLEALHASMRQVDFGRVLLLTDEPRRNLGEGIEWQPIEKLSSREDYSRFMLRQLADYITTEHALCIQWDGFVLNGAAWRADFLDFDYIGAVWPHFRDRYNVGNGGFSLRSRRLLQACRELPSSDEELEDVAIGRTHRPRLEKVGIRFAPEEVARCFSYERTRPTGSEFGFHGAFNLVRYLGRGEAERLFRSLEPGLLARNERWEIFRWALLRGHLYLAVEMLGRLASR